MNGTSQQLKPAVGVEAKPARFVIAAQVEGFPVSIEIEGRAEALKAMINRLKEIGATPPEPAASQAPVSGRPAVPLCPIHHAPMKSSRKPGKFYCAKRADDGEYCRETA